MDLLEAFILGIVQGATEFLPVSSSGHLVLVSWWLNLDTPPLSYSILVHLGTTTAVLIYFWQDWLALFHAGLRAITQRTFDLDNDPELRLLVYLIIGTIPTAIIGLLLASYFEDTFSEPTIVSISLLITAVLLIYGEYSSKTTNDTSQQNGSPPINENSLQTLKLSDAIFIGCAQAVAIMPGISRSGSTIAGGMFRGLSRPLATRYSFLLATPIILAAGAKQLIDVMVGGVNMGNDLGLALLIGFLTAAIVGYICIALMLQLVRQHSLYGFAAYCTVFGLLSLVVSLLRG